MKTSKPVLLCIPGFLGIKSDFDFIDSNDFEKIIIDVCGKDAPFPGQTWKIWEDRLVKQLRLSCHNKKVAIVGYSLGARIALNLISSNPSWIKAAIIISARPALNNTVDLLERETSDQQWAYRFEQEPWQALMESWNSQSVFEDTAIIERFEKDYRRSVLANVLKTFSVCKQKIISDNSINIPTLICWGEKDKKFKQYAMLLTKLFNKVEIAEIPDSGHRVHLDSPNIVFKISSGFIKQHLN